MLGNYLQQTTSADDISDAFFLGALRVKGIKCGVIAYYRLTSAFIFEIMLTH